MKGLNLDQDERAWLKMVQATNVVAEYEYPEVKSMDAMVRNVGAELGRPLSVDEVSAVSQAAIDMGIRVKTVM